MSTKVKPPPTETQTTREQIISLLDELPPESLFVLEQFARFLQSQVDQDQPVVREAEIEDQTSAEKPPYLYPTISVPASSLKDWINLLPEGYEGDALADTEALYDEV